MKYGLVVLGIFGLDQFIKNKIEKQESLEKQHKKIGKLLVIRKCHNTGMAMNLGDKRQKMVAGLSLLMTALVLVLFFFSLGKRGNALLHTGLAFLLGGGFSNTYDRLKRKYVVDYISFPVPVKWLREIVFNIADFCIMIGAWLAVVGKAA